jgi:REP element-mobilizing transposase RayT
MLHIELTEIGESVNEYLKRMDISHHAARLDNYVIMPNHVHLLVTLIGAEQGLGTQRTASPTTASPTSAVIPQIVHGLKSYTKKLISESVWQRSYHDHIVRNEAEYQKIWDYIDTNVQNWKTDVFYKVK